MQIAWEVYHVVAPHLSEEGARDVTPMKLARSMPIAFASELPKETGVPLDTGNALAMDELNKRRNNPRRRKGR